MFLLSNQHDQWLLSEVNCCSNNSVRLKHIWRCVDSFFHHFPDEVVWSIIFSRSSVIFEIPLDINFMPVLIAHITLCCKTWVFAFVEVLKCSEVNLDQLLGRMKNLERSYAVTYVLLSVYLSICPSICLSIIWYPIHFFLNLYLFSDLTKQVHMWYRCPLGLSWNETYFCVEVELKGKGQTSFQGHIVHKGQKNCSFVQYLKNGVGKQLRTW